MCGNVLSRDVGHKLLVAIGLAVEDEAVFGLVLPSAKALCAEEDAQFEWHVEAGQSGVSVGFGARDIVDTEPTIFNEPEDFFDADLSGVVDF
jgi:hypothetical protein